MTTTKTSKFSWDTSAKRSTGLPLGQLDPLPAYVCHHHRSHSYAELIFDDRRAERVGVFWTPEEAREGCEEHHQRRKEK